MNLFEELKRRNVIRVAGLYLVGAWLIVQVAETLLPIFHTPDWVLQALVVVLAVGFIPALAFAWVFELTPQGLKRESEVDRSSRIVDHTARRLDMAVIVLLMIIGGLILWNTQRAPPPHSQLSSAEAQPKTDEPAADKSDSIADKSIAVLPFADFSPDGDQGWFADGLTEEILNALTRTPDLLVSARTSSFRYKGSDLAIPQIAAELGVAHVLEGSVRSSGTRIRVTAQLIRAADGFHLWSQIYDRDVADMIAIQEDLATQIATAMQTGMDPNALAAMADVGTQSVEAYQAYMRGVAEVLKLDREAFRQGYVLFEQARTIDPRFAAAQARAARFWLVQLDPSRTGSGGVDVTPREVVEQFNERIDLAIQHASNPVDRQAYRAEKALLDLRLRDAIELQRAVIAERPTDSDALRSLLDLSTRASDMSLLQETLGRVWSMAMERLEMATAHLSYAHRGGDRHAAAEQALQVLQRWPDNESVLYQAHRALLWDQRVSEAQSVFDRWRAMQSRNAQWSDIPPARQACAEGRRGDVERLLLAQDPENISQRWHLLMLLGRQEEANQLLMAFERDGNTQALAGFLTYRQFDPTPFPSLMRVLEREKIKRPPPLAIPFACPPAKPSS